MDKQRLSFDMTVNDHKYLKMCCAKLGVSLKDFMTNAINDAVYTQEDKWFDELPRNQIEEDGENFVYIEHDGTIHAI